jgi:hypothetical protein
MPCRRALISGLAIASSLALSNVALAQSAGGASTGAGAPGKSDSPAANNSPAPNPCGPAGTTGLSTAQRQAMMHHNPAAATGANPPASGNQPYRSLDNPPTGPGTAQGRLDRAEANVNPPPHAAGNYRSLDNAAIGPGSGNARNPANANVRAGTHGASGC